MNDIGTIASIIAAITGIVGMITGIIAIRNSKGSIIKRIERKQNKLYDLEQSFYRTYGLNEDMRRHYDIQLKKEKINNEIDELRKRI